MATSTTDHQFIGAESSLQEPHFDEEATVLSARPVVPLSAIAAPTAKASFPHPWILGLGLIGALLLGVFATAIYYSRSNDTGTKIFPDEVMAGAEGKSNEPLNSFSGPAAPQPTVAEAPLEAPKVAAKQPTKTSAEPETKPRARLVDVIRNKKSNQPEEESLEDRRAARREARQERRRAGRQRDSRTSDDLLRIREIFEGSPRP